MPHWAIMATLAIAGWLIVIALVAWWGSTEIKRRSGNSGD